MRAGRAAGLTLLVAALLTGCGGSGGDAQRLRYAVIGDSYSNGEALTPDQAWPVRLARRLHLDLVDNEAVSGWTTEDALRNELPGFERAKPEVATLLIGANDLVNGVAGFRERFRTLLRRMEDVVGEGKVVVVTVPDFSRKPAGRAFGDPRVVRPLIERMDTVIRQEARRAHAPLADIVPASRQTDDPSPDGLHPGPNELEAWTDAIEPVARRAWAGQSP